MARGGRQLRRRLVLARLACTLVVRSASGEPLPEARFVVEQASEPVPELCYVTGPDGMARTGLPPGETALRFFLPDGRSQLVEMKVRGEADATYWVTLDVEGMQDQ